LTPCLWLPPALTFRRFAGSLPCGQDRRGPISLSPFSGGHDGQELIAGFNFLTCGFYLPGNETFPPPATEGRQSGTWTACIDHMRGKILPVPQGGFRIARSGKVRILPPGASTKLISCRSCNAGNVQALTGSMATGPPCPSPMEFPGRVKGTLLFQDVSLRSPSRE
jgi:hypothetical protein